MVYPYSIFLSPIFPWNWLLILIPVEYSFLGWEFNLSRPVLVLIDINHFAFKRHPEFPCFALKLILSSQVMVPMTDAQNKTGGKNHACSLRGGYVPIHCRFKVLVMVVSICNPNCISRRGGPKSQNPLGLASHVFFKGWTSTNPSYLGVNYRVFHGWHEPVRAALTSGKPSSWP